MCASASLFFYVTHEEGQVGRRQIAQMDAILQLRDVIFAAIGNASSHQTTQQIEHVFPTHIGIAIEPAFIYV